MRYVSTRGRAPAVSLEEALFAGPAPDGGLYMPESLPERLVEDVRALGGTLAERALVVARALFGDDLPDTALEAIVRESLSFEIPLVPVEERLYALELFHGPTHAFKDVGARFMARLMLCFLSNRPGGATVLVATSGDTGSAVAHAFYGLEGIRVVVLFPRGKVSPLQQKLFTTLGGNVTAIGIEGTFDDCQRLVKRAFADPTIAERETLVSANSINVGRLLPQSFYYVHLVAELPEDERDRLVVATPSGNFGNLTAGLMAKRMGAPIDRLVAATNVNDVVPEYLASGAYRPRPSIETLSNAMDVGDPSNFQRISWLYGGDLEAMRRDIAARVATDEETLEAIRDVHAGRSHVLDPHSAIGYLAAKENRVATGVFLATAHPAKFRETVESAIGTSVPLPPAIVDAAEPDEHVVEMAADYDALASFLLS